MRVSERYSHGQGQQQSSLPFPFKPSMPRDFETYWEKDSENYKEGRELEPFQVKRGIARHHEKTEQKGIEESDPQVPPERGKNTGLSKTESNGNKKVGWSLTRA